MLKITALKLDLADAEQITNACKQLKKHYLRKALFVQ